MAEDNEVDGLMKRILDALSRDGQEVTAETTQEGNTIMVNLKRRPSGEATWFTAEDGSTIYHWKDKFSRQERGIHPPFSFQEKVLASGFLEPDEKGLYRFHVDADGRLADNFYIASVPSPDQLRDHVGMPLELIVQIIDERKSDYQISNIQNYDTTLVEVSSVPPINPSETDIDKLELGKRVVVKGKLIDYGVSNQDRFLQKLGYPIGSRIRGQSSCGGKHKLNIDLPDGKEEKIVVFNPPQNHYDEATYGIVETEDGRRIKIRMHYGRVHFSGGVLEGITITDTNARSCECPENGDEIRIGVFVTKEKGLAASSCDPCWLDKPSEKRQTKYNQLRNDIDTNIRNLEGEIIGNNYAIARRQIAELRTRRLIGNELERIRSLTESIPQNERPIQTPIGEHNSQGRRDHFVKDIDEAYGVRLESMTMPEFLAFTRAAVNGEINQIGKHTDTTYLFCLTEKFDVDKPIQERLIEDSIEAMLKRTNGKTNDEIEFYDNWGVEQGLLHLGMLGTESSADKVFNYLRDFVGRGHYLQNGWEEHREDRLPHYVWNAVSAVRNNLSKIPQQVLQREIPYLMELGEFLTSNADEDLTINSINQCIAYVKNGFSYK